MPSDKDYRSTKKIKQGAAAMNEQFQPLADWIDSHYDVKTLNLVFDYLDHDKTQPRLQVCLEYERDKVKFDDPQTYNFDQRKQHEIAQKFQEIISIQLKTKPTSWIKKVFGITYPKNNLFVYFSDFESVAKIEATDRITNKEIDELKAKINNLDLWEISKAFSGVTFFLYTDEQVHKYQNSETLAQWKDWYYQILEKHDEFGYFTKDGFYFKLDSKENFDQNYESNWYYYYK